jgi:nicotinamidase-related amidase
VTDCQGNRLLDDSDKKEPRAVMSNGKALLVIDVQVGIIEGPQTHRSAQILERINSLLAKARASGTPVIYVQHDGPGGHPVEVGSPGWQIHPSIAPAPGEPIVHKHASDSFFETTLERDLQAYGINHIVITGAMSEYCVDTTCRRATSLGYDVTLVSDAHTTWNNDLLSAAQIISHHNTLLDGFGAGDHVISVKASENVELAQSGD